MWCYRPENRPTILKSTFTKSALIKIESFKEKLSLFQCQLKLHIEIQQWEETLFVLIQLNITFKMVKIYINTICPCAETIGAGEGDTEGLNIIIPCHSKCHEYFTIL